MTKMSLDHFFCDTQDWDEIIKIKEKKNFNEEDVLKYVISINKKEYIDKCIKSYSNIDKNEGLYEACYRGNEELTEHMVKLGALDYNIGLQWACYGGHKKTAECMIKMGGNCYNEGLKWACYRGCYELIKYMIELGATYLNYECLQQKEIQIYLLENGVTRKQIKSIQNIENLFRELNMLNYVIEIILNYVLIKDLAGIVSSYVCL